ncbi:unnamed protein product [Alopecurus aequalis]
MLLSSGGRRVLCNAVLTNLATYYMSSFLLPQGVLESIDKRRRAFFWTGSDTCSGARCLIAWEKACLCVQEGGLGMRDLRLQNVVLLLNFLHRLHQRDVLPWKAWFHGNTSPDLGEISPNPSFLEKIVSHGISLYRSVTRCALGDGRTTSFWLDHWMDDGALCFQYPALFSHVTRAHASVATVLGEGMHLQPRLSRCADMERSCLLRRLTSTTLTTSEDTRTLAWGPDPSFSSRAVYRMISARGTQDPSAKITWSLRLPTKIKIFAVLLEADRLSTRANLLFKQCVQSDACERCGRPEDGRHLFFGCPFAVSVWSRLGIPPPSTRSIWDIKPPRHDLGPGWNTGTAVILWHLWKARNDLVFNTRSCDSDDVLRRAAADVALWRARFALDDRADIDRIRLYFLSCCN